MSEVRRIAVESSSTYKTRPSGFIVQSDDTAHIPASKHGLMGISLGCLSFLFGIFLAVWAIQFIPANVSLTPLPSSAYHPLIYPGAQQTEPSDNLPDDPTHCMREIDFQTKDTSEHVQTFYKDVLTKEGWVSYGPFNFDDGVAVVYSWSWYALNRHELGTYILSVFFPPGSKTKVQLVLYQNCPSLVENAASDSIPPLALGNR